MKSWKLFTKILLSVYVCTAKSADIKQIKAGNVLTEQGFEYEQHKPTISRYACSVTRWSMVVRIERHYLGRRHFSKQILKLRIVFCFGIGGTIVQKRYWVWPMICIFCFTWWFGSIRERCLVLKTHQIPSDLQSEHLIKLIIVLVMVNSEI